MSKIRSYIANQISNTLLKKNTYVWTGNDASKALRQHIFVNNSNEIDLLNGNLCGFGVHVHDLVGSVAEIPRHNNGYCNAVDIIQLLDNNRDLWEKPVIDCEVKGKQPATSMVFFSISAVDLVEDVLGSVISEGSQYGFTEIINDVEVKKKHVCIEFSSPNIAKPFHAGHLRSTIIGQYLANILSRAGHKVTKINYLGDWGAQFGLLLTAYQKFGDDAKLKEDPMQHLFELYVKANALVSEDEIFHLEAKSTFSRLEHGDPELLSLHRKFRDLSIEEFRSMYSRLGIEFDEYDGEHCHSKTCLPLLEELRDAGVIDSGGEEEGGGGVLMFRQTGGAKQTLPLLRSDGSTLYLSRDLAAIKARREKHRFDHLIYVVDMRQYNYFLALFELAHKGSLVDSGQELSHVKFGRVLGMSTRRGEVVLLRDILEEGQARMMDIMNSKQTTKVSSAAAQATVADVLARSAIYVQDLRCRRTKDYRFVWDKMLSNDSDTGVSLQYTHARLANLVERFGSSNIRDTTAIDLSPLVASQRACLLILHLARYTEVISCTLEDYEPHHIVKYLFRLSHLVNRCYGEYRVADMSNADEKASWLLVYECSRRVLENGLSLLGLPALHDM